MTKRAKSTDLSVVLAIRDVEDSVGRDIRRIAEHLRGLRIAFEIIAVNDGSRDNSFALLGLLAAEITELRVLPRDASGRAFLRGATEARGGTVLLADAGPSGLRLPALGWALSRLAAGREMVVLRGRFVVANRLLALPALARASGRLEIFERNLERQATGLAVEIFGARPPRSTGAALLKPFLRFLAA